MFHGRMNEVVYCMHVSMFRADMVPRAQERAYGNIKVITKSVKKPEANA